MVVACCAIWDYPADKPFLLWVSVSPTNYFFFVDISDALYFFPLLNAKYKVRHKGDRGESKLYGPNLLTISSISWFCAQLSPHRMLSMTPVTLNEMTSNETSIAIG